MFAKPWWQICRCYFVMLISVLFWMLVIFLKLKEKLGENQDGGVGGHTAPPRTNRTDRKSNGKEVRHQGNKK